MYELYEPAHLEDKISSFSGIPDAYCLFYLLERVTIILAHGVDQTRNILLIIFREAILEMWYRKAYRANISLIHEMFDDLYDKLLALK